MISAPPTWLSDWAQILGVVVSAVLTFFLVILYKRQQQQLAAQHEAVLEVTDVEWFDDKAILWISNFGNGVAKNLGIKTLVKADNGEHRNFATSTMALKRLDVNSEWGNHIRSDEEDIPFTGKSKVRRPAPPNFTGDWISVHFSTFVRRASKNNASEVKFCHVIEGVESSGEQCVATVEAMTQSVDPQQYGHRNSLENLPGQTLHSRDKTFLPYFRKSWVRNSLFRVYVRGIRLLDLLVPKIKLRPRPVDASGTKRVKRVLLKRQLKRGIKTIRKVGRPRALAKRFIGGVRGKLIKLKESISSS